MGDFCESDTGNNEDGGFWEGNDVGGGVRRMADEKMRKGNKTNLVFAVVAFLADDDDVDGE